MAKSPLRFMILLGIPSLGLTYAVTILTAYLPTHLAEITGPVIIGLIIGAEGFFGLFMPFIFGVLVDRIQHVGERIKYLLPATIAMAAALVISGLLNNLLLIGLMVALFYIGYYAFLAPYWALYLDLIPAQYSGQSRSAEGAWRVTGAFGALVSGGFLLSVWRPLPFLIAAVLIALVTLELSWVVLRKRKQKIKQSEGSFGDNIKSMLTTLRTNPAIRRLAIANACWNATLQSIQAFVVLYFVEGIGRSHNFVSGLIFPVAAIGLFIMAPLAGKLADRFGYVRVLKTAAIIYAAGVVIPGFTHASIVILAIPIVAAAATAAMILPYAVFMRLLGPGQHGAMSGLFGFSRGVGSFFGPLLSGLAITFARPLFAASKGYSAFWIVAGAFSLLSIIFIGRVTEPTASQA